MKFIRKNGRIIPIRDKSGASAGSKKRYPGVKGGQGSPLLALAGAAVGDTIAPGGIGLVLGGLGGWYGSKSAYTKPAKGESLKHAALRVSNFMNRKKK